MYNRNISAHMSIPNTRIVAILILNLLCITSFTQEQERMDEMWGSNELRQKDIDSDRGQLFKEGNYAMFIHWGLYSSLANEYKGKTYYGIGEWIMSPRMANIPVNE